MDRPDCACATRYAGRGAHADVDAQHTACLEEMGAAAAARRVKHWENILHTENAT